MASDPKPVMSNTTVLVAKRERSDDDEDESIRRVLQRTQANKNNYDEEESRSLKQLVLEDLKSDDETVLENVLENISRALYNGEKAAAQLAKIQQDFFILGGHVIVVRLMQDHPYCQGIQEQGIRVITNAIYRNKGLQNAVVKVDGIEATLVAMKWFPNNWYIQRNGLQAFINIIHSDDGNAKSFVLDLKGVPIILGAMVRFSDNDDIAARGCAAVSSLCRLEELRKPIFETNALSVLANARDTFREHSQIEFNVGKAMASFAAYLMAK